MSDLHPRLRAPERETLEQFLDQHRAMVVAALDGVAGADAAARLLPHTEMTIRATAQHCGHLDLLLDVLRKRG